MFQNLNKKIHGKGDNKSEKEIFEEKSKNISSFWEDFQISSENINIQNKRVLEIGSGVGALSAHVARLRAKQVIGIDTEKELINFSNQYIFNKYPHLSNNLKFLCCKIENLKDSNFDLIISHNTFEHINNFNEMIIMVEKKLKPGGKLYTSFAPLYYSPYGDHRRFFRAMENLNNIKIPQKMFPWMHLIIPDKILNKIVQYFYKKKTGKIIDFQVHKGINKLKYFHYKKAIDNSNLKIKFLKVIIKGEKYKITKLPMIKNLFIKKIIIILQKPF